MIISSFRSNCDNYINDIRFLSSLIAGILNDIVPIRAQRGAKVVLRCTSSGTEKTWFGPDLNDSAHEKSLMYFSNHLKNPNLNLSNYFVQANEGKYDLTIFNFQKVDIGIYRCRFHNNRTFDETKYNVSLLGMLTISTCYLI